MKRILFLLTLLLLLTTFLSANAEGMYDFVNLLRPFVTDMERFPNLTVDEVQSQMTKLSSFTCKRTNFSDRRTRINCTSKDTYVGKYSILFSFYKTGEIQFMEIQASHPDIDKTLAKSSFGLDYYADFLSWQLKNKTDFITKTKYQVKSDLTKGVFTTEYTDVQECLTINETSNILCVAYKEKTNASEKNQFLLSLVSNRYFYARPVF